MTEENSAVVTQETPVATEQAPAEQPPDVAGETQAVDPSIAGRMDDNELNLVRALERKKQEYVMRIGEIEVNKSILLGYLQSTQEQEDKTIQGVAKRLGLEGKPWNVMHDGTFRLNPEPKKG